VASLHYDLLTPGALASTIIEHSPLGAIEFIKMAIGGRLASVRRTPIYFKDFLHPSVRGKCPAPRSPGRIVGNAKLRRTCVDAPVNASTIFPSVSMWSGADVCPTSMCDFSRAANLYGDARIGSNTLTRALLALSGSPGFPNPVSMTVCPYLRSTCSHLRQPRSVRAA
jgi:hypothetical protein